MSKPIVTIIGLGVVGGSYAMALTAAGYEVYGVDCDKDTVAKATARGFVTAASTQMTEFVAKSDVVVIAVYPAQVKTILASIAPYLKERAIVTDVAGIKSHYVDEIESLTPSGVRFVFAHPMAGREKKGVDYADARVFKGANFILIDTPNTDDEAAAVVRTMAVDMGFANVMTLSADKHDEIISYVSQLPHAIAVALVNSDSEERSTEKYVGDSYRDLTRIADINEKLWSELFLCNASNLLESIAHFERGLDEIKDSVKSGDKQKLEALFAQAAERKHKYAKK